jgi:hypothetical protein
VDARNRFFDEHHLGTANCAIAESIVRFTKLIAPQSIRLWDCQGLQAKENNILALVCEARAADRVIAGLKTKYFCQ